jgi:hypothetical protein
LNSHALLPIIISTTTQTGDDKMATIKAKDLKTGMVYHDGCEICVTSETKCFVTCLLSSRAQEWKADL